MDKILGSLPYLDFTLDIIILIFAVLIYQLVQKLRKQGTTFLSAVNGIQEDIANINKNISPDSSQSRLHILTDRLEHYQAYLASNSNNKPSLTDFVQNYNGDGIGTLDTYNQHYAALDPCNCGGYNCPWDMKLTLHPKKTDTIEVDTTYVNKVTINGSVILEPKTGQDIFTYIELNGKKLEVLYLGTSAHNGQPEIKILLHKE